MDIPGPVEPGRSALLATMSMRLDAAPRGSAFCVVRVTGDDAISDRLAACGVWQGAELECIAGAPFGGPLLFRIHGYRLALRRCEAARVVVAGLADSGAVA